MIRTPAFTLLCSINALIALLALVASAALVGCSQPGARTDPAADARASPSGATTGRALLREAVLVAQRNALPSATTNWNAWLIELEPTIAADAPPSGAYPAIQQLLRRYGDAHSRFIGASQPPVVATSSTAPAPVNSSQSLAAPEAQPAHAPIPSVPEGTLLNVGALQIAYVVLPPCPGESEQARLAYSCALREVIQTLSTQGATAWIIDLRLNGGGNVWPMLAGLWPLLGTGIQATSITAQGVHATMGCNAHTSWMEIDREHSALLTLPNKVLARTIPPAQPRAVLIGPWTMSSGELIAGALQVQPNTRLFGEPTAGLTTGTNTFYLSDGSLLILSVDHMGDRYGRPFGKCINPTDPVSFKDWPTSDDAVARAACEWITTVQPRPSAATRESRRE